MNYIIDQKDNFCIIKMDTLNDEIFQQVINEILEIKGLTDKIYVYYTYFTKDYSYCILDFNRRKYNEEEIEKIANGFVKKK